MTNDSGTTGGVAVGHAEDQAALAELVSRYAMALDTTDEAAFLDLWLPGAMSPESAKAVMDVHRPYFQTMHNVTSRVHVIDGDAATGTTYCVCTFVREEDDGRLMKFDIHFQYENERFAKRDGRWYVIERPVRAFFSTEPTLVRPGLPPL